MISKRFLTEQFGPILRQTIYCAKKRFFYQNLLYHLTTYSLKNKIRTIFIPPCTAIESLNS